MNEQAKKSNPHELRGLAWLVSQLDRAEGVLNAAEVSRLLEQTHLTDADLEPYVEPRAEAYTRRCVVRRENYELLVLTWNPSQCSAAHDHSGSLCVSKVVRGTLTETRFKERRDGLVSLVSSNSAGEGASAVEAGSGIHAMANLTEDELLVTVHVYSPPLPESRRFSVAHQAPAAVFRRQPTKDAPTIAIIGGGFTGTMVLANLLRLTRDRRECLNIYLFDKQAAPGEGAAYRTADERHLLNVRASCMSAWPDQPDDFLRFVRARNSAVREDEFLPRKVFGAYVRDCMLREAQKAGPNVSVTLVREHVTQLRRIHSPGWRVEGADGITVDAELVIVAAGHQPPADPIEKQWTGSRARYVRNPWASLVPSLIRPTDPVLMIGSGLTAVDVAMTLNQRNRTAPIVAISRHGLAPRAHLRQPAPAARCSAEISALLENPGGLSTRRLVHEIRCWVRSEKARGIAWQQAIDGLRPVTSDLWRLLSTSERNRFLRHARSFWETHRHRVAPAVADDLEEMKRRGVFEIAAGKISSVEASDDSVQVIFTMRDGTTRIQHFAWVVNCTGPGAHTATSTHSFLRPHLQERTLACDELALGLLSDPEGRALDGDGNVQEDLLIVGTLRKSTLWESTAVPELRKQAQTAARVALETLFPSVEPQGVQDHQMAEGMQTDPFQRHRPSLVQA